MEKKNSLKLLKIIPFITFGLFAMSTFANDKTDYDYLHIRKQIETICADPTLSTEERAKQIYPLLPVTDKDLTNLYFGPNYTDEWGIKNTEEGKECYKFIHKTRSIVPVEMIIEKYQDTIDKNPIDIHQITNLEHNIDKYDNFVGFYWYRLPDYMDANIALPLFPNEERTTDYNVARTDAFIKLLKQQSDDYVLHFILLVAIGPSGDLALNIPDDDTKLSNGTLLAYASPQLIKTFPQWYKAWNKIVPTLCQRLQSFYKSIRDENPVQKVCGDLITAKKYHISRERQKQLDEENAREIQKQLDKENNK